MCVVTTSRADYGIVSPIVRAMRTRAGIDVHLIVSGMHLAPGFGHTVDAIVSDGFAIGDRVESLAGGDAPLDIAGSIARGVAGFAACFDRLRPDVLLVTGDRFEMYAAAVAALPFAIPVAHVHGGELTFGAIDDALRHSMTKLSHLHFAATAAYARRIVQLGEEPWRVHVSGAPSLDRLATQPLASAVELRERFGVPFDPPPILITFHPETLAPNATATHIDELLAALAGRREPLLFTLPNADTGGRIIAARLQQFVAERAGAAIVENFGDSYVSVMAIACAMVGNSSSGIIEAASFGLPVVDIGERQAGRFRPANVIGCDHDRAAIAAALERALDPSFRASLASLLNPYASGNAATTIADVLASVPLDRTLLVKHFHDVQREPVAV